MRVNELLTKLDDLPYPATTRQTLARLQDPLIELPDGTDRLSAVLGRTDVEAFNGPDDARLVVLSGLDSDAIGRRGYSDRDPPGIAEHRPDRLSL